MQKLHNNDERRRFRFAQWMLRKYNRNPNFLRTICFTDESTFTQCGCFNNQNKRCWARKGENPHCVHEVEKQKRWKVQVWIEIVGDRLVGPFFIEGNFTGLKYTRFLERELPNLLAGNPVPIDNMWWQQDGAPPHNCLAAYMAINRRFQRRFIGKRGLREWPLRSPDLTPCDFWLWGKLKEKCYRELPTTRENMIERIGREVAAITPREIRNACRNIPKRLQWIIRRRGGHIEQLL